MDNIQWTLLIVFIIIILYQLSIEIKKRKKGVQYNGHYYTHLTRKELRRQKKVVDKLIDENKNSGRRIK